MCQEDGSFQPTSWSVNKDSIFEIILKKEEMLENGKYSDDATAQIISEENIQNALASRNGKMLTILLDGDEYEIINPAKGMLLGRCLKGWVQSHYRFSNRHQRTYLSRIIGEAVRFLLHDVNCSALPSNMAVMVVLFTVCVRRMEKAGKHVNLKKGACRKDLLSTMHFVLKESLLEREHDEAAKAVRTIDSKPRMDRLGSTDFVQRAGQEPEVRTFTHKGRVAAMAVSAEEIQNMLGMMKRIESRVLTKFIETTISILWEEENRYMELQIRKALFNDTLAASFSVEGLDCKFDCMRGSELTGTPSAWRSLTAFTNCDGEVSRV